MTVGLGAAGGFDKDSRLDEAGGCDEAGGDEAGECDESGRCDESGGCDKAGGHDGEVGREWGDDDTYDGKRGDVEKESGVGEEGREDEGSEVNGQTCAGDGRSKVVGSFRSGLEVRVCFLVCDYQNNVSIAILLSGEQYIHEVQYVYSRVKLMVMLR